MKKIAPLVYENLTTKQRIAACIEALARGDEDENRRLIRSCPKLTYVKIDARFSETMDRLLGLAMAVEADLKECVLRFLIVFRTDPESSSSHLQDFANIREAWKMTTADMGINEEAMASAGPSPSPVFELVEDLLPEPDAKKSEILSAEMLACFG